MSQSLSSVLLHIIFSTENREPFVTAQIETELHPYMASLFRELNSPALALDGTADHIHALCALRRTITIANLIEEVKTSSSRWIKTKGREFRSFQWQRGYGAFSIGESQVEIVKSYIRNQKQHHRRTTFEEEYRQFLKRYRVEYDERYVWD